MNELVALMGEIVAGKPEAEYLPANVLDVVGARKDLGWSPKTNLPEGLALTWRWILTHPEAGAPGEG
ncbi:MAG TPA: hypothetical protein VGR18_16725 [Rubrobacter sp.]|nr:hypothetical protein [Rubrobacter sp.]